MLFQYVANYSKKMKHTRIELSKFKLLRKRIEVEKQELEAKSSSYIVEVIDLQCQICASKIQTNKTFQRELNKL
jgi:hypothetical protein